MAIEDYADLVREGGTCLTSIHMHYNRGRAVTDVWVTVFDRESNFVHTERVPALNGDFLEQLREASVVACLTYDWAHDAFTHPRLDFAS